MISFTRKPSTEITEEVSNTTRVEEWRIYSDVPILDPVAAIKSVVPKKLTPHSVYKNLFLIKIGYSKSDELMPNLVPVTLTYSNNYSESDGLSNKNDRLYIEDNPLKEAAIFSYSTWGLSKTFLVDLDQKPFATTAGEPLEHIEEVQYAQWQVQKNVVKYPPVFGNPKNQSQTFINSDFVNFAGVRWDPLTLLIKDLALSSLNSRNGVYYYTLSFTMQHNPDNWLVKKLNAGTISLQPVKVMYTLPNGVKYPRIVLRPAPIKLGNPGQHVSSPIPLQNAPTKPYLNTWPITNGMVYPEFMTGDPRGFQGVTINIPPTISPTRLQQIWALSTLRFRTKTKIKFTGNVPLG